MPSLSAAKAINAAAKLSAKPVALFVGGTSGIGKASVEAFARYAAGNAHIIISGRNASTATQLIPTLPTTPESTYEFLPCDTSLIANVATASAQLKSKLSKLNYLFISSGVFPLGTREETSEGLDRALAINFYSRCKFVLELMPLLQAARDAGEDARVVIVLAAGRGKPVDLEDLGLVKSYGFDTIMTSTPTYTSLVIEELSKQHPEMSFAHLYPGVVDTPILSRTSWLMYFVSLLVWPFTTKAKDSAEWILLPFFAPEFAKGAFHLNEKADSVPQSKLYLSEDAQKRVYEHLLASVNKP